MNSVSPRKILFIPNFPDEDHMLEKVINEFTKRAFATDHSLTVFVETEMIGMSTFKFISTCFEVEQLKSILHFEVI